MSAPKTSLQPHGEIDSKPKETYGQGEVLLRLGNGGAGATGLLEALATDYLSTLPPGAGAITWTCNHSRNTQLALFHAHIDLALTYERDAESVAAAEGWSHTAGCVFHDHFCLAGPAADPAGLRRAATSTSTSTSLPDALARIARAGAPFHSRADGSATMAKERALWAAAGLRPWEDGQQQEEEEGEERWYHATSSASSPADALRRADAAGAYLLTDRSTLLRQTAERAIAGTTVFVEPVGEGDPLMNSCFALYSTTVGGETARNVRRFLDYLLSERGQRVVGEFGREEAGLPFFARVEDGCARERLVGGVPRGGRWVFESNL